MAAGGVAGVDYLRGVLLMMIWRCAAKIAKDSMIYRKPVEELLSAMGYGVHERAEARDEDMTAKELAEWVRRNAVLRND